MQERKQRNTPIERDGKLFFICKKCWTEKELTSEFWRKESKVKMWFNSTCKECLKIKDIYYREKSIDKIRERNRIFAKKYRETHKDAIKKYSLWYRENRGEKIKEWQKIYREKNKEKIREYKRNNWARNKLKRKERLRKNQDEIQKKVKERNSRMGYAGTHSRLARLVKKLWIRPSVCSICNYEWQIVAHHPDYSKEYEVVFCCQSCHQLIHLWKIVVSKEKKVDLKEFLNTTQEKCHH